MFWDNSLLAIKPSDNGDKLNKNMSEWISENIWKLMAIIVAVAAISICIIILFYFSKFDGDLSIEHEKWGTFGDFVGGSLNPLLSFLALISLLLTIILQTHELKATREELELSREAQQKSEVSLKEQAETLEKQLEQAKKASNAEYFFRAVDRMQDESIREARRRIFELAIDHRQPADSWHSKDVLSAEKVCQTYDLVGMMIKNGFVEESMILSSWHTSIIKSWQCTMQIVESRRLIDGDEFWGNYEWLYNKAKKYS